MKMKNKFKRNKIHDILITLSILQLVLILTVIIIKAFGYLGFFGGDIIDILDIVLLLLLLFMFCSLYYIVKEFTLIRFKEKESETQKEMIKNIEALHRKMRMQRHDFLNHIQVIYSLVEMKEYNEVNEYLEKIYSDIESINKFIKTQDIAINALLQAKYSYAERKNIKFNLVIKTDLKNLHVSSWEMCRILGNVIDNGIYATENFNGEKEITVIISETISEYLFNIKNTGDTISDENKIKIFNEGFTTKQQDGEGMGLYIVQEIVSKYSGKIDIVSYNNETEFIIKIPKQR